MARVWVLSASLSQRRQVEDLMAHDSAVLWRPQPFQPETYQVCFESDWQGDVLSSRLASIGCPFEVETNSDRYLFYPGLGIKRQQLDEAGEVVIRFGQLKQQIQESAGSVSELERRLRVIEGQPWLDLLEPYRQGKTRYHVMPRAV